MEKRPTHAVIDIGALRFNYHQVKRLIAPDTKIMAIVKANAYGHGDVDAAKTFESMGCDFFGVAVAEEGERLRNNGIKKPIVVLGGIFPNQIKAAFALDLTPVLFDLKSAALMNEFAMKDGVVKCVHVKIDTGMGRLGIKAEEAERFFKEFTAFGHLRLEGLCSHFSSADDADKEFTNRQLAIFRKAVKTAEDVGLRPEYLHMANSAAIVELKEAHFNLVRPGLMLYGAYPAGRMRAAVDLKPVMRLCTRILHLKDVPAGTPIGYGRTFVTNRPSVIATLPIGYGDGLMRGLSNKGHVIVGGILAQLVGTVCMDLVMCDVTHVDGVREGDEAVLLGSQGAVEITAEETAKKAGTISYEILCNVGPRVPRIYV